MSSIFGPIASRKEVALPRASASAAPPASSKGKGSLGGRNAAGGTAGTKPKPRPPKRLTKEEEEKIRKQEALKKVQANRDFDSALDDTAPRKAAGTISGSKPKPKQAPSKCPWCMGSGCKKCSSGCASAASGLSGSSAGRQSGGGVKALPSSKNRIVAPLTPAAARVTPKAGQGKSLPQQQQQRKGDPSASRAAQPSNRVPSSGASLQQRKSLQQPPALFASSKGRPAPPSREQQREREQQRQRQEQQWRRGELGKRDRQQGSGRLGRQDSFVVDDDEYEEEEEEEEDWRKELRSMTGYDPSKFRDYGDDRSMEVGWRAVQAEESRSKRLGREADREAEEEELRHAKEKSRLKKQIEASKAKKRRL